MLSERYSIIVLGIGRRGGESSPRSHSRTFVCSPLAECSLIPPHEDTAKINFPFSLFVSFLFSLFTTYHVAHDQPPEVRECARLLPPPPGFAPSSQKTKNKNRKKVPSPPLPPLRVVLKFRPCKYAISIFISIPRGWLPRAESKSDFLSEKITPYCLIVSVHKPIVN